MGIFSSIKEKLFGKAEVEAPAAAPAETVVVAETITTPAAAPVAADLAGTVKAAVTEKAAPVVAAAATAVASVDVAVIMDAAVKASGQKLDWRKSIVDMMKALGLDSSLAARKELADELSYTGDKSDSATMNVWLHKALMKALAENGGKVPADLLD